MWDEYVADSVKYDSESTMNDDDSMHDSSFVDDGFDDGVICDLIDQSSDTII